jgi:RNA polymerase sigma factor (sigma-70 family)
MAGLNTSGIAFQGVVSMLPSERNKLIEDNMGLVGKVIKDRVEFVDGIGIYTYDDLYQIGCIGLCKAADAYRPGGRASFSTYAYVSIRNEIFSALEYATLRRSRELSTDPLWLAEQIECELPDESLYDLERALADAQSSATGIYAKGIAAIRLLAAGYSHREIGRHMGASDNNVSAWVARARKNLRARPDIAAALEELKCI